MLVSVLVGAFLVVTIPSSLAVIRVFSHMALVTENLKVRRALVLLVPISVMNA